ncbi:unnamed protein product [Merluccius merluccius]
MDPADPDQVKSALEMHGTMLGNHQNQLEFLSRQVESVATGVMHRYNRYNSPCHLLVATLILSPRANAPGSLVCRLQRLIQGTPDPVNLS